MCVCVCVCVRVCVCARPRALSLSLFLSPSPSLTHSPSLSPSLPPPHRSDTVTSLDSASSIASAIIGDAEPSIAVAGGDSDGGLGMIADHSYTSLNVVMTTTDDGEIETMATLDGPIAQSATAVAMAADSAVTLVNTDAS